MFTTSGLKNLFKSVETKQKKIEASFRAQSTFLMSEILRRWPVDTGLSRRSFKWSKHKDGLKSSFVITNSAQRNGTRYPYYIWNAKGHHHFNYNILVEQTRQRYLKDIKRILNNKTKPKTVFIDYII